MAYRMITQVVFTGARVLGRSFAEAYRQAQASSKYQAAAAAAGGSAGSSSRSFGAKDGMTLDEATKILNVKPPKGADTDMEEVFDRFKRLFDANDPKKGGSFYLQSKVLRARERIEKEVGPFMEQRAQEEEIQGGRPKMYKDR